jgi:hypothetical protein
MTKYVMVEKADKVGGSRELAKYVLV